MSLALARRFVQFGPIVAAIGALVYLALMFRTGDTPVIVNVIAMILFAGGLIAAWLGRRILRLTAPENVIARWVVSHDEWRRYVATCREREALPDALPGAVTLDREIPSSGAEILALRRGFVIFETFLEAGTSGARVMATRVVEGPVHLFELDIDYSSDDTHVQRTIRIPVPRHALERAAEVERHWMSTVRH